MQTSQITRGGITHMVVVQSVILTTTVVNSGPAHCVVYWISHNAINFDSDWVCPTSTITNLIVYRK